MSHLPNDVQVIMDKFIENHVPNASKFNLYSDYDCDLTTKPSQSKHSMLLRHSLDIYQWVIPYLSEEFGLTDILINIRKFNLKNKHDIKIHYKINEIGPSVIIRSGFSIYSYREVIEDEVNGGMLIYVTRRNGSAFDYILPNILYKWCKKKHGNMSGITNALVKIEETLINIMLLPIEVIHNIVRIYMARDEMDCSFKM